MDWYHGLKAAHVLSAVVWIGGMFFAYFVLRPSLPVLEPPARMALHAQVFRRFFAIVWVAMLLQLGTGFAMIELFYGGFADLDPTIATMMSLGLTMAIVFLAIFFGPYRAFKAAPGPGPANRIRWLMGANLLLGVLTILVAMLG